MFETDTAIARRLEYLRGELRAERISMGELIELQGYGENGEIDPSDVELLEAAGMPEFSDDESATGTFTLTIELGNEAMQTQQDIARALRKVADELEVNVPAMGEYHADGIRDENGNTVGHFGVPADE